MARLPQPGGDSDNWGSILNDYLSVSHNTDGTIKPSVIAAKADDVSVIHGMGNESIGGIKTFVSSPIVPTPTNTNDAANKGYVDNAISADVIDASMSVKGVVQLANDLSGTATNPTVISTHLTNALPINQGGTGSTTQSFVDLTTAQTAKGIKTFSDGIATPGLKLSTSPTSGYVLTSDASGNASWQGAPTAVQGTFTTSGILKQTVYNVRDYGAVGDGNVSAGTGTDNATPIQNAMDAAGATGGILFFPPGVYRINSVIVPKSNVTVVGCGASSILFSPTTNLTSLIMHTKPAASGVTLVDFAVDRMTFIGPVTSTTTTPSRSRTRGNGAQTAIWITGSLDGSTAPTSNPFGATLTPAPATNPCGLVQNIAITNCVFRNFTWLPTRFFGITGKVYWSSNESYNNMDVGFGYNEEVVVSNNHVMMSADNGISISRGNSKITCTGNTVENIVYTGIFVSGFSGYPGPNYFSIVGNVIRNVRDGAIAVMESAGYGVVSGNTIDRGYYSDNTNAGSIGIAIQGNNGDYATGTYTRGVTVIGNQIKGSCMAGIYLQNCDGCSVQGNNIIDPGTQYLFDGVTPIATNDTTQNIGILLDQSTTFNTQSVIHTDIRNNLIYDSRGTPHLNYGIYPQTAPTGVIYDNNTVVNAYQMPNRSITIDSAPSGTYPSEVMSGPDATIGKVVIPKGNARYVVQTTNDGSVTSVLHLQNTGASSGSGVGFIASSGAALTSGFIGGELWARTDASSNSNLYWRILSNGSLTTSDTGAAVYLSGTANGPILYVQSNLVNTKGRVYGRTVISDANYTIKSTDHIIAYTTLTTGRTATLPTATGCTGQFYIVKDETGQASTKNITIATTSSQTIDGATSYVISTNYGYVKLYSNGTNWMQAG